MWFLPQRKQDGSSPSSPEEEGRGGRTIAPVHLQSFKEFVPAGDEPARRVLHSSGSQVNVRGEASEGLFLAACVTLSSGWLRGTPTTFGTSWSLWNESRLRSTGRRRVWSQRSAISWLLVSEARRRGYEVALNPLLVSGMRAK